MQIDWFTTVAQAVNFLVLLAILKFVLFDRIVASIDARRSQLNAEREDARENLTQAEREKEKAETIREELETARETHLHEAKIAAEDYRGELEEEVRLQTDRMRERFHASLRDEERQLISELVQTAAEGVAAAAERALEDLADTDLQSRIVQHFCETLSRATLEERQRLREVWGRQTEPLIVRSNREFSDREREDLRGILRAAIAVEDTSGPTVPVEFEVSDDLTCGLEISGAGYTVGWSIRSYLADLEERIQKALAEEAQRGSVEAQVEAAEAEGDIGHSEREREANERTQQTAS